MHQMLLALNEEARRSFSRLAHSARLITLLPLAFLAVGNAAFGAEAPAAAPTPLLTLTGDHSNGVYKISQPIRWRVELNEALPTNSLPAKYAVKDRKSTRLNPVT